jgi:hypothetical protein
VYPLDELSKLARGVDAVRVLIALDPERNDSRKIVDPVIVPDRARARSARPHVSRFTPFGVQPRYRVE